MQLCAPKSTYASSITTTLLGFDVSICSILSNERVIPVGTLGFAIKIVLFAFFDKVFAEIGPIEPSEVIIVGDSLTSDIRGGNNAGILTCWYNPKGDSASEEYRIDYEIRNLQEIRKILNEHE